MGTWSTNIYCIYEQVEKFLKKPKVVNSAEIVRFIGTNGKISKIHHFDPPWLATPISENFQTRWKFFFCYIQSDFGNKKFIEQCFHTLSAPTLLKRKSLIDLTW